MSEEKAPLLVLKVELINGKPSVKLGTGNAAVLSLALQCADLEVKNVIMMQDEIATQKPVILKPESGIQVPRSILSNL